MSTYRASMNYEEKVNENKTCVEHKNLTIGEIWMKSGLPTGKDTFISKEQKPRIKYYDFSFYKNFSK
jgi:hypothetical protein